MRLSVIGCSGSVVGATSSASCYLLESDGHRPIIVDIGNGSMGPLQQVINPSDCDLVVSHLHPDHFADIASLTVWRYYSPMKTDRVATVCGPEQLLGRAQCCMGVNEDLCDSLTETFTFRSWEVGQVEELNGYAIEPFRADHPGNAHCLRFTEIATGKTFAFSGDTGPAEGVRAAARGVDVFLCEATWEDSPHNPTAMHLTGTMAGKVAQEAQVGRLLLTHLAPWTDPEVILAEAQVVCSAPIEVVKPGQMVEW